MKDSEFTADGIEGKAENYTSKFVTTFEVKKNKAKKIVFTITFDEPVLSTNIHLETNVHTL